MTLTDREKRILEGMSTAVLVFDGEACLRYLNPAGEMLLGLSARKALGIHVGDLVDNAEVLLPRIKSAAEEYRIFAERELTLKRMDGSLMTVDCTVTPQMEPGRTAEVLVEMIQVDRHLRIVREGSLIEQNQVVRQLVRGMAHEIKNPLGGIRGAAQLLERELESEEQREFTRIIIDEADRLRSLVNRMLGPNNLPSKRTCNIHQVLEHVRSLVLAERHQGLVIHRDYDPSIPDFAADPEMLIQAVLNIVRNAARELEGGGNVILRTRTRRQFTIGQVRHRLVLCVGIIDDGPGVPPEMMETLFYPMVTGHADGTGLGLAIAQSLINLHGGLIECESRPGKTVFTLLLPLEPSDEQ